MNKQECDIMNVILEEPYTNQRALVNASGHSLGIVNKSIKSLIKAGYLDANIQLTSKAKEDIKRKKPKNAVILAAGFGMRMVPINTETPKGLLEVNGEPLIERLIKQLHEVNIQKIYVIVGFMKERYEYLIDEYGVELVVNVEYIAKNNLHSLKLIMNQISNTYIVPCDIWCKTNPFRQNELYSWYMVSDGMDEESNVKVNRKMELVKVPAASGGNAMLGISYLLEEEAENIRQRVREMVQEHKYDGEFWEKALFMNDKMIVCARVVHSSEVVEINTYEQLRELDGNSQNLKSDIIALAAQELKIEQSEIEDISALKKGMTNRSFLFSCRGKKYIMRIPGEGTDRLINRVQEAEVYRTIAGRGICDEPVYINPDNGYKITAFLEGVRMCDPYSVDDLEKCMNKLRTFHGLKLKVAHEFDIFAQIEFYEKLWEGVPSVYKDYKKTKEKVFSLKPYIENHIEEKTLTHIDAVPDNFLFYQTEHGEELQLTDWEYAGMQDPHVDIAMFCVYALYDRESVERLIKIYFVDSCSDEIRIKIYCYIAACGLLWSNWCEYKRTLGVEFGEYSLRQYRFAKDYYRIVSEELKQKENVENV